MERRDPEEVGLSWFGNRLEGKGAKINELCVFIYKAPWVLTPHPCTLLWPILNAHYSFSCPASLATLAFTLMVLMLGMLTPESPLVHSLTSFRSLLRRYHIRKASLNSPSNYYCDPHPSTPYTCLIFLHSTESLISYVYIFSCLP